MVIAVLVLLVVWGDEEQKSEHQPDDRHCDGDEECA